MEPMSTTPNTSPVTSPHNSVFLPSFLFGDNQPSPSTNDAFAPKNRNSQLSAKLDTSIKHVTFAMPDDISKVNASLNASGLGSGSGQIKSKSQLNALYINKNKTALAAAAAAPDTPEKNGPPSVSLLDSFNDDSFSPVSAIPDMVQSNSTFIQPQHNQPLMEQSFSSPPSSAAAAATAPLHVHSPTFVDPFELWVTLFGFAQDMRSSVLQFFSRLCTISDRKLPSQGNWVHVKLASQADLDKIMSYNGKVILNQIMVGVQPYRTMPKQNGTSPQSPKPSSLNDSNRLYPAVRPLNQSNLTLNASKVSLDPFSASAYAHPHQSSGIVTKAMEYLFGW